ncbi:MAG TPA: hypothetical protein VG938_15460 [Verrucomicrobiae bacterium]|jgi:hypothetical protein|nr:hypothetical protein [Verrucomicrobiae bacterium]
MDFTKPMRRLLRCARTGKFFRGDGRWTSRVDRALDFPHLMHVVHTCLLNGFTDMELVLQCDGRTQKALPLNCH